jgi:hypothetical protein
VATARRAAARPGTTTTARPQTAGRGRTSLPGERARRVAGDNPNHTRAHGRATATIDTGRGVRGVRRSRRTAAYLDETESRVAAVTASRQGFVLLSLSHVWWARTGEKVVCGGGRTRRGDISRFAAPGRDFVALLVSGWARQKSPRSGGPVGRRERERARKKERKRSGGPGRQGKRSGRTSSGQSCGPARKGNAGWGGFWQGKAGFAWIQFTAFGFRSKTAFGLGHFLLSTGRQRRRRRKAEMI